MYMACMSDMSPEKLPVGSLVLCLNAKEAADTVAKNLERSSGEAF